MVYPKPCLRVVLITTFFTPFIPFSALLKTDLKVYPVKHTRAEIPIRSRGDKTITPAAKTSSTVPPTVTVNVAANICRTFKSIVKEDGVSHIYLIDGVGKYNSIHAVTLRITAHFIARCRQKVIH